MAKKTVAKGELDFDDNGDLKKIEKDAKKAGKGLKDGAKGAHSMDRRLKGAAQASSNSTKNFSKMSQGISGGLVPAYATLAASLFAVDAAFQALKRASDLRVQSEGMAAYAASTGIALKSIARDLQAATGFQLDYKEAAESASIAVAAGFSADQITQIGKAARIASIALGRDFADSYQRLLKGITKAEPELLDELGIILRLEKATKVYAAAVGKNAKDLTAYERQQAVFNDVMDQTAKQYAAVGKNIPVNVMGQLGAKFTDITDSFLKGIAPIAEFFGSVLVNSTGAATAALGVFAASILRNVIPSAQAMTDKLREATDARIKAQAASKAGWGGGITQSFKSAYDPKISGAKAQALAKGDLKDVKSVGLGQLRKGKDLTGAQKGGLKRALAQAEAQYRKHNQVVSGMFVGKDKKTLRSLRLTLTAMDGGFKGFVAKTKLGMNQLGASIKLTAKSIQASWQVAMARMSAAAARFGRVLNRALGVLGWVGMLVMLLDMFKGLNNMWDKILIGIGNIVKKIGEMMKKLGQFIQKLAEWSPARLLGFEGSLIGGVGKIWEMAGEGVVAGGEWVEEKGKSLEPAMQKKRDRATAKAKVKQLAESVTARMEEVKAMKEQWLINKKLNDEFDVEAARKQMYASTGGLNDLATLMVMTEDTTGAYTDQLDPLSKSLVAHYRELGKTEAGYLAVANAIEKGDLEGAKTDLVDLTNIYGSHVQALKDVASMEEGRLKRLGEMSASLIQLPKAGQEMKVLLDSMTSWAEAGAFSEENWASFEKMFGFRFKEQGDAIKYATTKLKEYTDQIDVANAAAFDAAEGKVGVARGALGAGLFRERLGADSAILNKRAAVEKANIDWIARSADLESQITAKEGTGDTADAQRLRILMQTEEKLLSIGQIELENMEKLNTDIGKLGQAFKENFVDGMEKGIEGLINGTKTLKEAFADMAKGILASLAKVLAKMMTEKLLMNLFGGTGFGDFLGVGSGKRYGGIVTPSYAGGGIATGNSGRGYLARLHGTEAVVPLGNDRSIPVKMKGGAGSTNNTSVTVNVAEGQVSSEQTGETGGQQIGSVIAQAIEERLQDEQRPGGILFRPGGG